MALRPDNYSVYAIEELQQLAIIAGEVLAATHQGQVVCIEGQHEFELPCPYCGAAL